MNDRAAWSAFEAPLRSVDSKRVSGSVFDQKGTARDQEGRKAERYSLVEARLHRQGQLTGEGLDPVVE